MDLGNFNPSAYPDYTIARILEYRLSCSRTWTSGCVSITEDRTHRRKYCFAKTPLQTFRDSIPLVKGKLLHLTGQMGA